MKHAFESPDSYRASTFAATLRASSDQSNSTRACLIGKRLSASGSFLAEISVSSPRKLVISLSKKIFCGSKYPRNNLFYFEKRSTAIGVPVYYLHTSSLGLVDRIVSKRSNAFQKLQSCRVATPCSMLDSKDEIQSLGAC